MQQLTKREIDVLLYLLEASEPVTTKELAESHQVSVRTIKYDLTDIREWLSEHKQSLNSQRNRGIWLTVTDSERLKLKSELMEVGRLELFADQQLRFDRLVIQLLLTDQMITASKLAERLGVSKDTIVNDLAALEKRLEKNELQLKRQAGKGFLLTGPERASRLLIEEILQKEFTDYDIYKIMTLLLKKGSNEPYELYAALDTPLQTVFNQAIIQLRHLLAGENLAELNYSELLNLLIRVTIATVRLQNEFTIGSYRLLKRQTLADQALSYQLMEKIFANYHLPLFEAEYDYIYSDAFDPVHQQDILQLTQELIQQVSYLLDYPFEQDPQLLTNLYAHLSLRLSRKQKFVNEYNPFKDEIKQKHAQLFTAIQTASQQIAISPDFICNESFIAYIALHFLVSFEKGTDLRSVRAVYICSTGLGVTSLIKKKVAEELENIEIAAFTSVLNATEVIERCDPDLVISIFPVSGIDRPFVKVHPLPTKPDLQKIQQLVKKLLGSDSPQKTHLKVQPKPATKTTLADFSKELILQAYTVYERLQVLLQEQLLTEYREAFLLHVFLMVHRIHFDQQYVMEGNSSEPLLCAHSSSVQQIKALFAEYDLAINQSEISALFAYLKGEVKS